MSETITKPYRVLVSPRSGATIEFGSLFPPGSGDPIIDRVVVHGGKQWIPYWDKRSTNYDAPSRVDVYLRGQPQPRTFSGDASHFVQVFGGTRGILSRIFRSSQATVAGDAREAGLDYVLGCDLIVGAEPNFNKDADTVRRVQAALVSILPRYSHADFQALDAALKKDPGGLGKFGPLTKKAVSTFNRLYGFNQGEVIDKGTLFTIDDRRGLWVEGGRGAPIVDVPVATLMSKGVDGAAALLDPYVAEAKAEVQRAVEVKAAAKTPSEAQAAQAKVEAAVKVAEAVALTAPPEVRAAVQKIVDAAKAAQAAAPSEVKQEVAKAEGKASGSFFTREYGGVPVYAWGVGGISLLGILAIGIKMVFGGRRQAT